MGNLTAFTIIHRIHISLEKKLIGEKEIKKVFYPKISHNVKFYLKFCEAKFATLKQLEESMEAKKTKKGKTPSIAEGKRSRSKSVKCCYSVSLVYRENDFDISKSTIKDSSLLKTMVITDGSANSKDEALGIAINLFKTSVRREGNYNLMMWDVAEFPPNNCT
jgi:hypothetical protein